MAVSLSYNPRCVQPHVREECYVCRKALHLLRHVIQAHPPDAATACQLGAAQQAAAGLASSDNDTWQAALLLIQQLTQNEETFGQLKQVSHQLQSVTNSDKLLLSDPWTLLLATLTKF